MRSFSRRVGLVVLGALAVVVAVASIAWACSPQASIAVSPGSGLAGDQATVTGSAFTPAPVQIHWGSATGPVLGSALGPNFSVRVTIPQSAAPDVYYLVAVGPDGRGSVPFEVIAPAGGSPPGGGGDTPTGGGGEVTTGGGGSTGGGGGGSAGDGATTGGGSTGGGSAGADATTGGGSAGGESSSGAQSTDGGQGSAGVTTDGGQGSAGVTTGGGQGSAGVTTGGGQGSAGVTTDGGQGSAGVRTGGGSRLDGRAQGRVDGGVGAEAPSGSAFPGGDRSRGAGTAVVGAVGTGRGQQVFAGSVPLRERVTSATQAFDAGDGAAGRARIEEREFGVEEKSSLTMPRVPDPALGAEAGLGSRLAIGVSILGLGLVLLMAGFLVAAVRQRRAESQA